MKNILQQFLRRESHPLIQFIKYGLAGGAATAVDIVVFYLLSWLVFPALTSDDRLVTLLNLDIRPVEELVRSRHYYLNRSITFLFSNFTAYVINVLWVFEPGRHSKAKEIGLFYAVSGVSFLIGTTIGWALIRFAGFTTTTAFLANLVASVLINYVARKYYVFKG